MHKGIILTFIFAFSFLANTVAFSNPTHLKSAALKTHNDVRAKDRQRPLQWSNDLQQISQQWANHLARGCHIYHHKGEIPFGENLYRSPQATSIFHAVKAWADEKRYYNYRHNSCQSGKICGHYTQMVWKGTTDLGCAMQSCSNGTQIYVCSYFPAGNYTGARPF